MTKQAAPAQTRWLTPARLDRIEQVAIVVLWVFLVERVWTSANPLAPLLLIAETSVMLFVLIRRPTTAISVRPGDWMLAITATAGPLLIMPGPNPWPALAPLGIALVLFGNLFQVWAKLSLRRSFGIAPANRGIKISGPYRFVRHPMYAGYLVTHIGIFLLMPSLLNLAIYVVSWWSQTLRLLAEERLLGLDPAYQEFSKNTRWRMIPGVF
ncbi:methyltransferase family protein [Novosphingobium sp. NPDC080210]|uniref:methyltransferase family protein n=1 Tax=Novosphingobium sp. NPDC080210 TaxID=3390596 RepID=UPI003D05E2BD